MNGRYVKAGEGACAVCGRVLAVNLAGRLRKHWTAGLGSPLCAGSDGPVAEAGTLRPAPPSAVLRGCLPLPGGREFAYAVPSPLSRDDVARITTTLLLHVDGVAEKAWIEAVATGLVADMGERDVGEGPPPHRHVWRSTAAPEIYRCDCGAVRGPRAGALVSAFADVGTGAG